MARAIKIQNRHYSRCKSVNPRKEREKWRGHGLLCGSYNFFHFLATTASGCGSLSCSASWTSTTPVTTKLRPCARWPTSRATPTTAFVTRPSRTPTSSSTLSSSPWRPCRETCGPSFKWTNWGGNSFWVGAHLRTHRQCLHQSFKQVSKNFCGHARIFRWNNSFAFFFRKKKLNFFHRSFISSKNSCMAMKNSWIFDENSMTAFSICVNGP